MTAAAGVSKRPRPSPPPAHTGRRRLRRLPRPDRFFGPVASALFLLFAFAAVAHASGSGWVQAIGAVTAGLAVVGMIGPAVLTPRLTVTCVQAPRDAIRGEPLVIDVVASRALRCTPSRPGGPAIVLSPSEPARLTTTPPHRGTMSSVRVRLATAAPLGLLWWSVDRYLILPTTIAVAPGLSHGTVYGSEATGDEEGHGRPILALTGDIRGIRAYRHGDSRRRVHWRATAHTASLMVRETEEVPDTPIRLVADLSEDPARSDEQASDLMGAIDGLLAAGKRVLLETVEGGERIAALVPDRRSAGRRLARAGRNPYADLPAGGSTG